MPAKFRPSVEFLERRDTPAFTSTLSKGIAQLVGDGAADSFFIVADNGLLRHNPGLAGFASETDWDTTKAGTQTLAASAASTVQFLDLGGGDDSLQLGGLSNPASLIKAAVVIFTAGAGSDRLVISNVSTTTGQTYDINSVGVQSDGVNVTTATPMDGGVEVSGGAGADTFNIASTSASHLILGGGGADKVNVGRLGLLAGPVSVNGTGQTAITIDDRENVGGGLVEFADVNASTVVRRGATPAVFFPAADVSRLIFLGGNGADILVYRATRGVPTILSGGDGSDAFQVTLPAGAVGQLTLGGDNGIDTFLVNAPVPAGFGLSVNGGFSTGPNELVVASDTTAVVTHESVTGGTVQANAGEPAISFVNMGSVFVAGKPKSIIVNLPPVGANGVLQLADDPLDIDSVLTGPTITTTKFYSPTVSLTVNLGNSGDTILMREMDPRYAPTTDGLQPGGTFLRGGAGADLFSVFPDADSLTTVTGGGPTADPGDRLFVDREYPNQTTPDPLSPTTTYTLGRGPGALSYTGIEAVELEFVDSYITVGPDRGATAEVVQFDGDPDDRFRALAFPGGFTGGVRVAAGDFNADQELDPVVGTGPGAPTRVRVLDGFTEEEVFGVDPFEPAFTGGVYVATGDLNGDGVPEVVITPDEGGGPRVQVFDGATFALLANFFGIDDTNFRGGARAAVGDFDGDGFGDLIVAAGFGGGPRVAGYKGSSTFAAGGPKLFADFFLFEQTLRNGAFVAAGDVNNDGHADLIGGGGPGGGPRVFILDGGDVLNNKGAQARVVGNFFAGDPAGRGGVRVSARHLDGDGYADVVVGSGAGAGSRVTAYLGKNIAPAGLPEPERDFEAFPGYFGGVFVG